METYTAFCELHESEASCKDLTLKHYVDLMDVVCTFHDSSGITAVTETLVAYQVSPVAQILAAQW